MRLKPLDPADLTVEQKSLYDDMKKGIESNFKGFQAIGDDGALIGPWNPWLHFPKFGGPVWALVKALSSSPVLPKPVREIAILVTGTHFRSGYELYAHVLVAELRGLDDDTIATIVSGQKPAGLQGDQSVAYDAAASLVGGGTLPQMVYQNLQRHFGADGTAEFINLVGLYCGVSITLNGFNVPVPDEDKQ